MGLFYIITFLDSILKYLVDYHNFVVFLSVLVFAFVLLDLFTLPRTLFSMCTFCICFVRLCL